MKKTSRSFGRKLLAVLLVSLMLLSSGVASIASYAVEFVNSGDDTLTPANLDKSRYEMKFNSGWKFNLGDIPTAQYKAYSDSEWTSVDLPHDFSIEQDFTNSGTETESGNLPGGTGWYRKMFTMPETIRGKRIILNFDGAYSDTYVYVNNKYVGENHYGYNSFSFDITDYLVCNGSTVNLIAVKVVNSIPNSRWYSGSGIYRDVTMTIVDPIHVSLNGTQVETTESGTGASAKVTGEAKATVSLQNDSEEAATVTVGATVLDADGNEVSDESKTTVSLAANASSSVSLSTKVSSPKLWSVSSPTLYTMRINIYKSGSTPTDIYETKFGYRTVYWDASTGFYLNGESTKLKGVCLHSDSGALGTVQTYDAIYRQMSILKDMGVNAVRTSHNVASQVFIDVCNDIGMMVMEEFFDGWDSPKNGNTNDFSKYFSVQIADSNNLMDKTSGETWAQFVVTQAVKRDRNSPSIIIWSAANELMEATSSTNYGTIAANIKSWVSALDSRLLTQGNNRGSSSGALAAVDAQMDVIGGNYRPANWVNSRDKTKPFVATETASAVSSRGYYANSSSNSAGSGVKYSANEQVNAYDASVVSWGNTAADAWYYAAVNDWFSGEFVWTGFDYIGEPTPWNRTGAGSSKTPNSSYFGIVDTAGFAKDSYYLYRSMWNTESYTTHLVPGTWNQSALGNATTVPVAIYSNAKKVELYLNDELIGYATSTDHTTDGGYTYKTWSETAVTSACSTTSGLVGTNDHDLYAQFGVTYAEGTLSVKAYDESGSEITSQCTGSKSVTSGTTVKRISSKVWKLSPESDGSSYVYIEYTATDANGNLVNDYNGNVTVSINGTGADSVVFAGADNGNAATTQKYQHNVLYADKKTATINMFNGKALVIAKVLNTDERGVVTVSQVAGTGDKIIDGVSFEFTADDTPDEFEEIFRQADIDYEPTFYDIYNMLENEFNSLDGSKYETQIYYQKYAATTDTTENLSLETGYYGFQATISSSKSTGIMSSTSAGSNGLKSTGAFTFNSSSTVWYVEKQDDGTYYMSVTENGTKKYINMGTSNETLTLSETPQKLNITVDAATRSCLISTTDAAPQYINYSGGAGNKVTSYSDGTSLVIFNAEGTSGNYTFSLYDPNPDHQPIEDGDYVIYNNTNSVVISNSAASTTALENSDGTVDGDRIKTSDHNVYTFERVSGDEYYVRDVDGNYLTIGSSASLTLSTTPTTVSVIARADGKVMFFKNSQFIDCYRNSNKIFSTWESIITTTNGNEIFTLYRKYGQETGSTRFTDLYNALEKAIEKNPGLYEQDEYRDMLNAAKDGLEVLKSGTATDSEISSAVKEINEALKSLKRNITKFNSTLYKYGFNSSKTGSERYATSGAYDFSVQSVAQMKNAILANSDLVSQITEIIGSTEQANIELAAEYYARIYSFSFQGPGTTGGFDMNGLVGYKTAWNWWDKANSMLNTEKQNEGASVMGIYDDTLSNGVPVSHDPYDSEIQYICPPTGEKTNISVTIGGKSVTLTPLKNISVYVPEIFTKKNVQSGTTETLTSIDTDSKSEYSKYYWDTRFPFMTETDEFGINTYTYDSNDDTYMYRAYFDDENQTAFSTLQDVDEWGLNRAVKGSGGKGLFPFNYQMTSETDNTQKIFADEKAIYHYGMTFDTSFTLPATSDRKYNNGGTGEDVVFNFSGDDDVLVYVDGTLILDNGGIHGARSFSINFSRQSVTYQYAYDIESGSIFTKSENVTYTYGDDANNKANGITEEIQNSLNKLHEIYEGGPTQDHTLNFFYLERGSTDSNCLISFNLQPVKGYVNLADQEIVADYGQDINYDTAENNTFYDEAVEAHSYYQYIGVMKAENEDLLPRMSFSYDESLIDYRFTADNNNTVTIDGNYGTFTAKYTDTHNHDSTSDDHSSDVISCQTNYKLKDMQFTDDEVFYLVAKVHKDPIFASDIYYTYEKITYVPATTMYYEDDYRQDTANGITYTDGAENAWSVVNSGQSTTVQDTDMVGDSFANVYGYDSNYVEFGEFSNNSAHKVTVTDNDAKKWPKAEFKFTGTGFDVISLTSNKSGVFVVSVYNEAGKRVKYQIVDTYYGYSYGQVYRDSDGNPTLNEYVLDADGNPTSEKNTVMYVADRRLAVKDEDGNIIRDENGNATFESGGQTMSETVRYYDNDGNLTTKPKYKSYVNGKTVQTDTVMYISTNSDEKYTETPTYYDADGNLTTTETDKPAYALAYEYAYAYGWLNDSNGDQDALYQIPVMKILNLAYGTYTAKIEARYASVFDHTSDSGSYDLYLDAIRIYDPAGTADKYSANSRNYTVSDAYVADGEAFAYYKEIKDMIIGSNNIDTDETRGALFIDGRDAVTSEDLDDYMTAGPNNELYLNAGQSVAFEILATSVPKDIQIGAKVAKSAQGSNPVLSFTYSNQGTKKTDIKTATDMYYSISESLNLTWRLIYLDGKAYYTSGVIVIGNGAAEGSGNILSVTNIKWTFDKYGSEGYYRIPTATIEEEAVLSVNSMTLSNAVQMISASNANLAIESSDIKVSSDTIAAGKSTMVKIKTSQDVASLIIKDEKGNVVEPLSIAYNDVGDSREWSVQLYSNEAGTYHYTVQGVYENGYTDSSTGAEITINVVENKSDDFDSTPIVKLIKKFINLILKLFGISK